MLIGKGGEFLNGVFFGTILAKNYADLLIFNWYVWQAIKLNS